jgi:hypothetical protein
MPDQNQNTIPGTLRTLKTDLDLNNTNPQDRLQQAGNFVQARPTSEPPVTTPPVSPSVKPSLSSLDLNEIKQDIPESINPNNEQNESGVKLNVSALDESINLSLVQNVSPKNNSSKSSNSTPPLGNIPEFKAKFQPGTNPADVFGGSDNTNSKKPPLKLSRKTIITGSVAIVLLGLIGIGVYFYTTRSTPAKPTQTNDKPKPNTPTTAPNPTVVTKPLFTGITKSDIAFNDTEPIRKTIATSLNTQKAPFIELNLTKDGKKVSLTDISTAFGLTIPKTITDNAIEYWLYGYNQEGIYKLTATIQLKTGQTAKTLVDNWSTAIPRDLSSFSLNSPSRIVNNPEIKTTTITNSAGKVYNNYYYNYTSPTDSADVSSLENYIVIASSQTSMKYLLDQIK